MLSNNSSFDKVFKDICYKFDVMYAKRAFIHWFVGEGMESNEFECSREELNACMKDYEEIVEETVVEDMDGDF